MQESFYAFDEINNYGGASKNKVNENGDLYFGAVDAKHNGNLNTIKMKFEESCKEWISVRKI